MDEAALRAKIKAEVLAELNQEGAQRSRLNAGFGQALRSAGQAANSSAIREDYGVQPGEAASAYAAVLWAQMDAGMLGDPE